MRDLYKRRSDCSAQNCLIRVGDKSYLGKRVVIGIKYPGNPGDIVNDSQTADSDTEYNIEFDIEENMAARGLQNTTSLRALGLSARTLSIKEGTPPNHRTIKVRIITEK